MKTTGLSLEQAPPLSIPAVFFLSIPVGILVAAWILISGGAAALASPLAPQAVALTHAGTLGVLAMGMLGALYQMTPVVAGTPVPLFRLARLVHVLLLAGLAGFVWRLSGGPIWVMSAAMLSLGIAVIAFVLPPGWALMHAATRNETVQGMRLALASLVLVTVLGLAMASVYAGGGGGEHRGLWTQVHLTLAFGGWVGGLIMAVSWQVIPMFYLAPPATRPTMRGLFTLLSIGMVLSVLVLALVETGLAMRLPTLELSPSQWAGLAAAPAGLAVWIAHPILILRNISRRKRKRGDASLLFWRTGLASGLLIMPLAAASLWGTDPRWAMLFGWFTIWGWAGLIMHGMLSRIVPFLVWFHRFSARVGLEAVPSMRSLLSQRRIRTGFVLHLSSLLLGATAIIIRADLLAQLTGMLLAATAISMASMLIHVLKTRA